MNDQNLDRLIRDLLDVDRRERAADAIAEIGPPARAAVPNLIANLQLYRDDYSPCSFALALAAIGEDAKEAVPALIEILDIARKDEDWMTCAVLARALSEITMDPVVRKMIQERRKGV